MKAILVNDDKSLRWDNVPDPVLKPEDVLIKVEAAGVEAPVESIRISVDEHDWFTMKEAETVTSYKWEYGEPLYIRVLGEGLTSGTHKVKLTVATRTAYIPVPLVGIKERDVVIE